MKLIFLGLLMLVYFASHALPDKPVTITVFFNTPHAPQGLDTSVSINAWFKNFGKFTIISTQKRIDARTWQLTLAGPKNENFQSYSLSVMGNTYDVFINNKNKALLATIDTLAGKSSTVYRHFIVTTKNESEFSFGIQFNNLLHEVEVYKKLQNITDTAVVDSIMSDFEEKLNAFKTRYNTLMAHNKMLACYINTEILWQLWSNSMAVYATCVKGKLLQDSIKAVYYTMLNTPYMVYSMHATLLGSYILSREVKAYTSDGDLVTAVKKAILPIHAGLFKDYFIENFFRAATHNQQLKQHDLEELYVYGKEEVKDDYLKQALNDEHDRYINENKILPDDVLLQTKMINPAGTTVSLKQVIDSLQKSNKKRVVFDFWASWCGPCKQEITESHLFIDSIQSAKSDFYYFYFCVDVPEKYGIAKQFAAKQQITANTYFLKAATLSPLFKYYYISSIPYHVILDIDTRRFRANTESTMLRADFIQLINGDIKR